MKKEKPRQPPGVNGFKYRQQYGLIVICADETAQQQAFAALRQQGYKVKVVTV